MHSLIIAVEKACITEIEDVITAALWRYWELHPGREIAAICLASGEDRDEQIKYIIGRLQELMGKPDNELNQWPILIPREYIGDSAALDTRETFEEQRVLPFQVMDDVNYPVMSGRIAFRKEEN